MVLCSVRLRIVQPGIADQMPICVKIVSDANLQRLRTSNSVKMGQYT